MKKFINETISGKEKALKIGTNVPAGAIGLSWFNSREITPGNTVGIVDYSDLIPENRISERLYGQSQIVYADELGILRKLDGNYNFQSNDISVSDLPLSRRIQSNKVDIDSLDSGDYVHYKYVSRYFISAPNSFSISSENSFIDSDYFSELSIKVLDKNGFPYIDERLNRNKYRILLEPYRTQENNLRGEIPHRVIVYLDSSIPDGLTLVYDKVESNDSGSIFNMELGYTEPINAVPMYTEIPEESFVIDRTTNNQKIFSIKKLDNKYSEIINNSPSENGYQVIAPLKAFSDYRTYETFNWRLVARLNSSVLLSNVDYGNNLDDSNILRKTVNVAVLYDSNTQSDNSSINPYVFRRLAASPFNLFGYSFANPNAPEGSSINTAEYWKLDINDLSKKLEQYDILAWSPNSVITESQALRIRSFLQKSKTLILDLSGAPNDAAKFLDGNLLKQSEDTTAEELRIESSEITSSSRSGAWDLINGTNYVQSYYGVWGSNNVGVGTTVQYKSYKTFADPTNSFLNIIDDPNESASGSVARFIPYLNNSDSLSRGNILVTTFNLMNYCNRIYGSSVNQISISDNSSDSIYSGSDNSYPGIVEGPFKLLFNTCSYALYSAVKSSRVSDERSAIYNYVSRWYPSWTMNGSVLLDEEKDSLFTNVSQNTSDQRYARDLISSYDNVKEFMKNEFSTLSNYLSTRLNSDIDNIEIFIEVTNPSVDIVNANRLTEDDKLSQDIPSSYNLFRLTENSGKLYAETVMFSMELQIPSTYGDYIITDKPANYSSDVRLTDNLNVMTGTVSYPFDLECRYTYSVPGEEKYTYYRASLDANYDMSLTGSFYRPIWVAGEPGEPEDLPDVPVTGFSRNPESVIDNGQLNSSPSSSNPNNIFPYTGDIDLGNRPNIWVNGSRGAYATYIQWVLKKANPSYYPYNLDQYYGPATAAGVLSFQRDQGQRYKDGTVDSETKWYLAKFVRDNSLNISELRGISEEAYNYARAAKNTVRANQIENGDPYRKITFTGFEGPQYGEDCIFFNISPVPNSQITKILIKSVGGPWSNFEIIESGLAANRNTDINNVHVNYIQTGPATKVGDNFEINVSGVDPSNASAGYIKVKGNKLGGNFGPSAEGFGIQQIKIKGASDGGQTVPGEPPPVFDGFEDAEQVSIKVSIDINEADIPDRISAERSFIFDVTNPEQSVGVLALNRSKIRVSKLTYNGRDYSLGNTLDYYRQNPIRIDLGNNPEQNGYFTVTVPVGSLTSTIDQNSIQYALRKVKSASDNVLIWDSETDVTSDNPLTAFQVGTSFEIATSSIYFEDSKSFQSIKSLSSGYRLRSADVAGIVYDDQRKTVNINDGVLLFCDAQGEKYGVPTYSEIQSQITDETLEETDARLGTLILNNSENTSGMIYGFYDLNQNEFLGTRIDYLDYIDAERDVYIGVKALDADGDLFSDNEFIGSSGDILFRPVNIPVKYIAPVYSIVLNKPSAIKIDNVDPFLSRFDTWYLPVTKGYFERSVLVDGSFENSDWKNNFRGQTLVGIYSTSSLFENNSSKIYGRDAVDIYDESPIILDDKSIRLRRTPVLSWNHPTDYESSIFGIIKPVIKIEKRQSFDSNWEEIPYSSIRSINCQTGEIVFTTRVVPGDNSLIRVNYTIKSKNAFIKRVNSNPIPLNPLLDYDSISFNKPLFVYLLPKELYAQSASSTGVGTRQRIADYSYDSVINYTYDSEYFNKNSSRYNPFAILLAAIYVSDKPENIPPNMMDIRIRGGGVIQDVSVNKLINDIPEVLYNWDVYSADTEAYSRGGYVIIKMPESVKDNFVDEKEIYQIIKNNLTAGIVFEIHDMDDRPWS